jgi:hypothetical protein
MAGDTPAVAAAAAKRQTRRPLSRIVPAIPHRLSRTVPVPRPVTPDESSKGAATQHDLEPQPAVGEKELEKQAEEQLQPVSAAEAPMTPDSQASGGDTSQVETAVLAASPAQSADDAAGQVAEHHQGLSSLHAASMPLGDGILTRLLADPKLMSETNGHVGSDHASGIESKAIANGVPRKLNIPAELPPPFYPSHRTETDIDTPPADGSNSTLPPFHRSQLSAGAMAFNIPNGAPAMPAASHETDHAGHVQRSALTRPPPGFAPPEHTASFFPGHSYHPSAVDAPWPNPPYMAAQPDGTYENGTEFQSSSFAVGPVAYAGHHDSAYPPRENTNGAATSQSQSPSKSQFGEAKPGSERGDEPHALSYQNGVAHYETRFEESPFELAAHLSTQFGNPEFADFILQIRSPEAILVSIPVHGIIVVRSPVIAEATRRSVPVAHRSRATRRLLDVLTSDPFVTRDSLEEAIKVLYGAPLLSAQTFLYGLAPYVYDGVQASPSDARRRMRQLLSYIAAGRVLQLPSMQIRGVEIARLLLRWDTVDEVVQVALRSNSNFWPKKDGVEAEDPCTAALLNYAIDFMAYTFPVDFKLYTIAPELQDAPRLPMITDARLSTHNPQLSKIRFGDAPPEDDLQPTHVSRILSSILLSLPLPLIDRLFNHRATANQVGWTGVARIMRDVVVERENRRQKVLTSEVAPAQEGSIAAPLLNNVYTEERVEQVEESPLHPSGYRLVAQRSAARA